MPGVERAGDRCTALRLSAVHARQLPVQQPELAPLVKALGDLGEQGAGRDRNDAAIRDLPPELLGDLERQRL